MNEIKEKKHIRNNEVYTALKQLTCSVLNIFTEQSSLIRPHFISTNKLKASKDESIYYLETSNKVYWTSVIHDLKNKIEKTDEYKSVIQAFNKDRDISPHMEEMIGSYWTSSRVSSFGMATMFIYEFLNDYGILPFDEEKFAQKYTEFEDELYKPTITFEEITPIFGLTTEIHEFPLNDNLSIVKLSDEEINELFNLGIILGNMRMGNSFVTGMQKYAIKTVCELPKIFGTDQGKKKVRTEHEFLEQDYITTVMQAMRIFDNKKIYPIVKLSKYKTKMPLGFGYSYSSYTPVELFGTDQFILGSADHKPLKELFEKINSLNLQGKSYLKVGINRFSQANARSSQEDRLLDLMISAEALFLGSDSDNYNGELKYKLSHRASVFLKEKKDEQVEVYDFFQEAYKQRSSVVHGNVLKIPKHNGVERNIKMFNDELETYLRHTLIKMINIAHDNKSIVKKIDWRDYIFV